MPCTSLLTKNNDIFVLLNKRRDQFVRNFHQLQFGEKSRRGYKRSCDLAALHSSLDFNQVGIQ